MSGKDVRFGNDARALMLAGVDKLADAVQVRAHRCLKAGAPPDCDWIPLRVLRDARRVATAAGAGGRRRSRVLPPRSLRALLAARRRRRPHARSVVGVGRRPDLRACGTRGRLRR